MAEAMYLPVSKCHKSIVIITFALCAVISVTHSKIIGAFVLPHGGVAWDPKNFNTTNSTEREEAWLLHQACQKVGQDISNLEPEVIFLSTPHGIADYKNFVFYLNSQGSGFGDVDDCLQQPCRYYLNITLDNMMALYAMGVFGFDRNVSGLSGFGPVGNDQAFPLRWGEVIPLLFIKHLANTRVVIISQPTRRYTDDVRMIPELLRLGADLYDYLDARQEKIAVVISADLAHTHKASGPYGYSNASEPFDMAVGYWAATLNSTSLLDTAAKLVDRALSCGYTGLVMLHGMLSRSQLTSWQPHLYGNYHPSYYGMMAASFLFAECDQILA